MHHQERKPKTSLKLTLVGYKGKYMLLWGEIILYIAGTTAGIILSASLIGITYFIIDNFYYLAEAVWDEVTDLLHKPFKRNHKK